MSGVAAGLSASLEHSIIADEIGLASAIVGDVHLRTSYKPLFARNGDELHPVAVEGTVTLWRGGRLLDLAGLGWSADLIGRANLLGRILSIRNMANIGSQSPLGLLLCRDGSDEAVDQADLLLAEAEAAQFDPRLLIVMSGAGEPRAGMDRWRDAGASIALSDLRDLDAALDGDRVDFIRIGAPWLAQQMADAGAARLMRVAVERLREAAIGLLADAIASADDLQSALGLSADLMQGPYLAPPFRVGTVFDEAPRGIAGSGNIVRLFG